MNQGISTRIGTGAWATPGWREFRAGAFLAMLLSVTCAGQNGTTQNPGNGAFRPEKVYAVSPINQRPDANKVQEMHGRRVQQQTFAAINVERKRQMAEDSVRLVQFADELNVENLGGSLQAAMAKAEMIEKLAHGIREKMKLTVAAQ